MTTSSDSELHLLRQLLESLPDPFFAVDEAWRFTFVNAHAAAFVGRPGMADALIGRGLWDEFPEARATPLYDLGQRVMTSRQAESIETPYPSRGAWIELRAFPYLNGIAVHYRDITARKQAEEERARFARLVEESQDYIALGTLDGQGVYVNPAGRALLGFQDLDEVRRTHILACFQPEDQDFAREHILPAVLQHGRWSGDFRWRHQRTGESVAMAFNLFLITDVVTGEPLNIASVSRDIRERQAAERVLRDYSAELERRVAERTRALEQSNADLEQFASVASHDLQTPLRAVTNFAEVLADKYRAHLDERGQGYLRLIVDNGRHMQRLVDDLLTFSRVTARQRPTEPTKSGDVLANVVRRMQPEIDALEASVTWSELPVVHVDAAHLDQVWQNLVGNALKYRREGVRPRVHVSAERDGEQWRFFVTDNGLGIEPRYFERIFNMFQRLHARDAFEGTGIGLAIVKKIVERHGGTITVDSTPGQGTTFCFTLPTGRVAAHSEREA